MLAYAAPTSSPLRLTTQNTFPDTQRLRDVDESKTEGRQSEDLDMPYVEAHYHPLLFATITLCAMAELGLTAFLINAGIETKSFPSDRYHALWVHNFLYPHPKDCYSLCLDCMQAWFILLHFIVDHDIRGVVHSVVL